MYDMNYGLFVPRCSVILDRCPVVMTVAAAVAAGEETWEWVSKEQITLTVRLFKLSRQDNFTMENRLLGKIRKNVNLGGRGI